MEGDHPTPANARVAVVTGGNKGIGLEVCRQLAGNGVTVVLTARDEARGAAAVEKLIRDLGLSGVLFHQLDITDAPSIARLADFLKTRFGKLDILVNNAAIGGIEYVHDTDSGSVTSEEKIKLSRMDMDQRLGWLWENSRETYDTAKIGLQTNYYGTKQVIEALLPLLQASSDGRIVNVSSHFGQLRRPWCTLMEAAVPSAPKTRIAVVTGGNKGIGLEVCRQLAGDGATVVLTARDETRGAAAAEKLREAGLPGVIFHQLEITNAPSIARLAEFLKARFGKLDILINNAAIGAVEYVQDPVDSSASEEKFSGMDQGQRLERMFEGVREPYDAAREGVKTNYYGVKHVIEALLPLLQASSDGRIVNVSSEFGRLGLINNEELRQELNDVEKLTEERLDEVLATYLRDFEAGEVEARGWPTDFSAYKVAKAAMNAYSRILARSHPELRINCAHPGYVSTDMTIHTGPLTPEEGAGNVVKVALLPEGGPTGAYFALGEEAPFV